MQAQVHLEKWDHIPFKAVLLRSWQGDKWCKTSPLIFSCHGFCLCCVGAALTCCYRCFSA